MSISARLTAIREQLDGRAQLLAVSKTHPVEAIEEAYSAGQRHFGESYAQELRDKAPVLPSDIRWHFIGRLQKNKLKYIAPHAFRVHGLTAVGQAEGLVRRAPGPVHGLVNVNLGAEEGKVGVPIDALGCLLDDLAAVEGFEVMGLMCIPPRTPTAEGAEPYFEQLAHLAQDHRSRGHELPELSMGMSRDFPFALRHGATWVRVGTAIFGQRER